MDLLVLLLILPRKYNLYKYTNTHIINESIYSLAIPCPPRAYQKSVPNCEGRGGMGAIIPKSPTLAKNISSLLQTKSFDSGTLMGGWGGLKSKPQVLCTIYK